MLVYQASKHYIEGKMFTLQNVVPQLNTLLTCDIALVICKELTGTSWW